MPEHFNDWPWRQWAQRYPQAIALHGPQGELSWRQVAAAVQRQAASVVEGCGVALMGHNSLALLFAYLAALDLAFGWSSEPAAWPSGMVPLDEGDCWFHTRDRCTLHAGELRIAGRLDNLFFCGGEGVQPEDIERLLARYDGVRQAFIAPLADPEYGQRPVVVVDADVPLAALRAWLEPQLSPWQRPVAWYYLPPTLNQGGIKIPRGAIHAWLTQTPAP